MDDIADLSEVSVGTLYFYFKNKEDLLIQLMEDIGGYLRKMVGREFRRADSSIEGFKTAGLSFFKDFCLLHPEKVAILFRETEGKGPEVEKRRKF